jgi:NAD(P)H-flavin reductase
MGAETVLETNKIKATVRNIQTFSEDNFLLSVEPEKKFNFKAGQFVMITCNGKERPFSISSPTSEKNLEFLIKKHLDGELTPSLCSLKKGVKIEISGPFGNFGVRDTKAKEIVFIAAGTGVAPFRAMIVDALKRFPDKKINLIFGFRNDFYFEDFWRTLEKKNKNFKVFASCSQPTPKWKGLTGRVTEHLSEVLVNPSQEEVYICGPSVMVEDVKKRLLDDVKLKLEQIHVEEWHEQKKTVPSKKLKIGWFSFSCCEDSTIVFTELLNDHFFEWAKYMDFQHVRILKKNNKLEGLDVAFVEGAIASKSDEKRLKEIRKNCKKLVAIGSCASNGMPSAQRNAFDPKRKHEIEFIIKRFHLTKKVYKLADVVKVDDSVPGCPMNEQAFLNMLENCLKEFKIK